MVVAVGDVQKVRVGDGAVLEHADPGDAVEHRLLRRLGWQNNEQHWHRRCNHDRLPEFGHRHSNLGLPELY